MTNRVGWIAALILTGFVILQAQTPGSSLAVTNASTCPTPVVGLFSFCKPAAGGAVTFTDEGSAYAPANLSGTTAPVTTVFGRKGAVVAAQGDYSYAQLSSPPTSITCATVTISAAGFVGSACTLK